MPQAVSQTVSQAVPSEAITLTEQQLLQAIAEAQERAGTTTEQAVGLTTQEIMQATGKSCNWVVAGLKRLKTAGLITVVYVERLSLCDRRAKVPAYKLVNN